MKVLFRGGSKDGQTIDVPEMRPYYKVLVPPERDNIPTLQEMADRPTEPLSYGCETYQLERTLVRDGPSRYEIFHYVHMFA